MSKQDEDCVHVECAGITGEFRSCRNALCILDGAYLVDGEESLGEEE